MSNNGDVPPLEGFTKEQAESIFQAAIGKVRVGGFYKEEILREAALRLQLKGRLPASAGSRVPSFETDELARQKALKKFRLGGGFTDDELDRQAMLRVQLAGKSDETQKFWLAIVDHLNQALPYVSGVIQDVTGARAQVAAMEQQIRMMEMQGQQDIIEMNSRNYWLARIAKEQGIQIPPQAFGAAMTFGSALQAMGPSGQAYLNTGYNQAFKMGTNYGAGGEIRDGYMRFEQEEYGKTMAAKGLKWTIIIGGIAVGVLVIGGGAVTAIVIATRAA